MESVVKFYDGAIYKLHDNTFIKVGKNANTVFSSHKIMATSSEDGIPIRFDHLSDDVKSIYVKEPVQQFQFESGKNLEHVFLQHVSGKVDLKNQNLKTLKFRNFKRYIAGGNRLNISIRGNPT